MNEEILNSAKIEEDGENAGKKVGPAKKAIAGKRIPLKK